MVRLSTLFVLFCILTIAGALGATLGLATGMQAGVALALSGLAALGMALLVAIGRRAPQADNGIEQRLVDLSVGTHDLALQVGDSVRRIAATENRLAEIADRPAARAGKDVIAAEISELGTLVQFLATSVAAHEQVLTRLTARPRLASQFEPALDLSADAASPPVETPRAAASTEAATHRVPERKRAEPAAPEPASRRPEPPKPLAPAITKESIEARAAEMMAVEIRAAQEKAAAARAEETAATQARAAEQKLVARIRAAIDADRIDLYLQPLVTLPQRKVRYYEAVTRLRDEDGHSITGTDFVEPAERAGLMPRIDAVMLERCLQVLQRLSAKNREIGIFCNLSTTTLESGATFDEVTRTLDAHRSLAPSLVLEFSQASFRAMGPIETECLAALAERGCRFSIDHVADLRIEPQSLARAGVRFIKVPAQLLLAQQDVASADIHPADLTNLLGRHGIDLVAEKIEGEGVVVDLLDYDVRFGQGYLFAPPKVIRREAIATAATR